MKKLVTILCVIVMLIGIISLTGCTEAERVSHNVSKEADNFNVFRRVTVINARTDKLLLEIDGYLSVQRSSGDIDIVCQTGPNTYMKHFVGLNPYVIYSVEDLSGAEVDPYHFEIHYLPEGNVIPFTFRYSD